MKTLRPTRRKRVSGRTRTHVTSRQRSFKSTTKALSVQGLTGAQLAWHGSARRLPSNAAGTSLSGRKLKPASVRSHHELFVERCLRHPGRLVPVGRRMYCSAQCAAEVHRKQSKAWKNAFRREHGRSPHPSTNYGTVEERRRRGREATARWRAKTKQAERAA